MQQNASQALEKALPALQAAKIALESVNKGHITEMKNLGSPPTGVMVVGRVCLILMGDKITLNDPDEKVWKKT